MEKIFDDPILEIYDEKQYKRMGAKEMDGKERNLVSGGAQIRNRALNQVQDGEDDGDDYREEKTNWIEVAVLKSTRRQQDDQFDN